MKRMILCFSILMVFVVTAGTGTAMAEKETINIMCWEGYADKAFIDDFKRLVKEKYKIEVDVKPSYATGQEDFYNAAKNGTADLISPPADMPKTPRFHLFKKGNILLTPLDMKNIPNAKHMLPFFSADKSLLEGGKRYGLPYNCGPYGLAYNTAVVKAAPTSWNVFWDKQYAGKYTINNNFHKVNIWITALALGYKYEDLFNIDRLDRKKIQPKLNELVRGAKSLWDGEANPDEFPKLSLATTWGFAVVKANQKGGHWKLASPKEGGTAWIDYWCVTHAAKGMKKKLCEEWINLHLSPKYQAAVVKQQGVSRIVDNVGNLVTPEEKLLFHVGNNDYFKTVAIWQVMSEKTEKAFGEMWEAAKKLRKK
jgi:spermidine/putrescine transport system substrate-binding protein